jgi:hypothetical protein
VTERDYSKAIGTQQYGDVAVVDLGRRGGEVRRNRIKVAVGCVRAEMEPERVFFRLPSFYDDAELRISTGIDEAAAGGGR